MFLADHNHLSNFGRGHYGEHSCESYLKSEPVVKEEMSFKEKVYGSWTHETKTDHSLWLR